MVEGVADSPQFVPFRDVDARQATRCKFDNCIFFCFRLALLLVQETALKGTLQPIIQAAHLLQARKSDEDVVSVCEMCGALTPLQICKILNLYSPIDEFEQRVPISFINKVQAKLQERSNYNEQQVRNIKSTPSSCFYLIPVFKTLLMDIKYCYPVRFPFIPSCIRLEDIEIPDVLKLPMLEKI